MPHPPPGVGETLPKRVMRIAKLGRGARGPLQAGNRCACLALMMQQLAEQIVGDGMLRTVRQNAFVRPARAGEVSCLMQAHASFEAPIEGHGSRRCRTQPGQAVVRRNPGRLRQQRDIGRRLDSRRGERGGRRFAKGFDDGARWAQRHKQRRRRERRAIEIDKNVEIGHRDDPCRLQFAAIAQVNDLRPGSVRRAVLSAQHEKPDVMRAAPMFAVQLCKDPRQPVRTRHQIADPRFAASRAPRQQQRRQRGAQFPANPPEFGCHVRARLAGIAGQALRQPAQVGDQDLRHDSYIDARSRALRRRCQLGGSARANQRPGRV
ncbi:MAG: hypothetical protein IPI73_10485 [Betaproteobacteria bacterium]|nr:hypothetical protein [Betaproteobacteria bacterium]